MGRTTIEWTSTTRADGTDVPGFSFNPWWGCTKVSDGCKFCYAEALSNRYGHDVWGPNRPRRVLSDSYWAQPLRWNLEAEATGTRYRVFCASMADVFEEEAPAGQLDRLWELIRQTPHLDWQLLTKRPQLIAGKLPPDWSQGYNNVWLGTSVEDERVLNRIHLLAGIPAKVRFVSLEPLIGPLPNLPLRGIHWAIVGGESGGGAREMELAWARDIHQQCDQAGVAFFFKQTGSVYARRNGLTGKGGDWDQLPADLQVREMPDVKHRQRARKAIVRRCVPTLAAAV